MSSDGHSSIRATGTDDPARRDAPAGGVLPVLARNFAAGVIGAALALGCGGPTFDGRVYRADDMTFRLGPVPERWRAIDVSPARVAFRDDAEAATVAVNGRCGKDADDVPLVALTHHLFLHFTDRRILDQQTLELDGRAAMRTELYAALDGVPKRFVVYVLKKDGCVYDFMYIGEPDDDRGAVAEFDRFVKGFGTMS